MGISLFGLTPAATYPSLIKFGDNSAISGVLRALSDGLGNDLPIQVSNTAVNFTGTLTVGGAGLSPASGVSGAIQFSNGSAFSSDAANLFWDDTNNRLGIGTNSPAYTFDLQSTSADPLRVKTTASYFRAIFQNAGASGIFDFNASSFQFPTNNVEFGTSSSLGARVGIKGSGSTSATTSLLVQNSAGDTALQIKDDREFSTSGGNVSLRDGALFIGSNFLTTYGQSIGFFGAPVSSAIVEMQSTTRGFLPPRMTTTQRDAIATPATGLRIYNTTTNTNDTYNGTVWQSNSVSGVSGAIQFSNGSAFASDASNLFWDDTNDRLGIGTNAPSARITAQTTSAADGIVLRDATNQLAVIGKWFDSSGFFDLSINGTPYARIQASQSYINTPITFGSASALSARVGIVGSGTTSGTTSLLVQNSAGTAALQVRDDLTTTFGGNISASNLSLSSGGAIYAGTQLRIGAGAITILSDSANAINFAAGISGRSFGVSSAVNGGPNSTAFLFIGDTATGVTMGSNSNSHASAVLDLVSTTQGFLPPRMTTTQKNAIATPASGLVVYDSTTNKLNYNNGTVWKEVTPDGYTGLVTVNATPPVTFDIQNGIIVNVT